MADESDEEPHQLLVDAEAVLALMEERAPYFRELAEKNIRLKREMMELRLACKREMAAQKQETKKAVKGMAIDFEKQITTLKMEILRERVSQRYLLLTRIIAMILLAVVALTYINHSMPQGGSVQELRSP